MFSQNLIFKFYIDGFLQFYFVSFVTAGGVCPINFVWLAFATSLPSSFSSSAEVNTKLRPILTTSAFMVISSPTGAARK